MLRQPRREPGSVLAVVESRGGFDYLETRLKIKATVLEKNLRMRAHAVVAQTSIEI
jgi:hypothetical protein